MPLLLYLDVNAYFLCNKREKIKHKSVVINLANKTGFLREDGYILIGKTDALSFSQVILSKQGKQ